MIRRSILSRRFAVPTFVRPNGSVRRFAGFEDAQKAHRARLEMMQQERFVDKNAKVKRFHMRALWTPMLMKYWVPLFILTCGMIAVADNLTLKKSEEKREMLRRQGFGDENQILPGTGGMTLSDRNRYMQEHIDRVIHGEDTWKVAAELQQRYKEEQEMKQRLDRADPALRPMPQSPASMARQSKLQR